MESGNEASIPLHVSIWYVLNQLFHTVTYRVEGNETITDNTNYKKRSENSLRLNFVSPAGSEGNPNSPLKKSLLHVI